MKMTQLKFVTDDDWNALENRKWELRGKRQNLDRDTPEFKALGDELEQLYARNINIAHWDFRSNDINKLQLFGVNGGVDVTIQLPSEKFGSYDPASVNWSSFGVSDPEHAHLYAQALMQAAEYAAKTQEKWDAGVRPRREVAVERGEKR